MWNSFALAVQSLTALPILEASPTRLDARRAPIFFPLVGALLGMALAAVWTLGHRLWSGEPLVAAALTLAAGRTSDRRSRAGRNRPCGGRPGGAGWGRGPLACLCRDA